MALNKRPKIAIIGSGNIGGILAYHATSRKLGDIVLYDNVEGRAEGKSIDISAAAIWWRSTPKTCLASPRVSGSMRLRHASSWSAIPLMPW